jgi:hypothetical protein
VFVVNEHNQVIEAWAVIRGRSEKSPVLISLDHHTDCHEAFLRWVYKDRNFGINPNRDMVNKAMLAECSKIDWKNPSSVRNAAERLKNDEHIDAAIKADIIDHAYIINYQDSNGSYSQERIFWEFKNRDVPYILRNSPPVGLGSYSLPKSKMFIIPDGCLENCLKNPHDDECLRLRSDQAIESEYLGAKFEMLNAMAKGAGIDDIFTVPYILDIDLDYFHTAKSIQPVDPSVFYKMIRGAVAMTIALEPSYVLNGRLEGESIDSDWLLDQLTNHIHSATA